MSLKAVASINECLRVVPFDQVFEKSVYMAGAPFLRNRVGRLFGTFLNGRNNFVTGDTLGWALSFGFPITRQLGVKVVYLSSRTQEPIGQDTDSIGVGLPFFW
ncbi:MAG: hypothetical protein P8012_04195 [Desulfobacterales bacterium]